jgi:hypothetical protein
MGGSDWITIGAFVAVATAFFAAMWAIIGDVKKSAHARIDRVEARVQGIVTDCSQKKDDFITTKAFDRFERHLSSQVDSVKTEVTHLTKRIDDWIAISKNGTKGHG